MKADPLLVERLRKLYAGPQAVRCIECGGEIYSYETRAYGVDGAVHIHEPHCYQRAMNADVRFPCYWTDG